MNADGSQQMRLTNNPAEEAAPTWSPDGTHIGFISYRDGEPEIYVMGDDGKNVIRLTGAATKWQGAWGWSWSPDGMRIAFASGKWSDNRFNSEIYTIGIDGGDMTRLTNNSTDSFYSPAWSPDGTRIAFESGIYPNWEIYVMDADGANQTRLTTNPGYSGSMIWSLDSKHIVFTSDRDGNSEIFIMNVDGSEQINLTNNSADDFSPIWVP